MRGNQQLLCYGSWVRRKSGLQLLHSQRCRCVRICCLSISNHKPGRQALLDCTTSDKQLLLHVGWHVKYVWQQLWVPAATM